MNRILSLIALLGFVAAEDATAASRGRLAAPARLTLTLDRAERGATLHAHVSEAWGNRFGLFATTDRGGPEILLGVAPLEPDGSGHIAIPAPGDGRLPTGMRVHLRAGYLTPAGRSNSEWATFGMDPLCETLDFNFFPDADPAPDPLVAGTVVNTQYSPAGITFSAESNGGTDLVIIFDSSNPTSNDSDLVTPGYGANNDEALGNLLIVADDAADGNNDGLIDDPGDEELGGTIIVDFMDPVTMCSLGLLDLDKGGVGSFVRFFDVNDALIQEIALPSLGDNSFQELVFLVEGISRVEVQFISSGGIPFMNFIPCPSIVNFDTNTFGVPHEEFSAAGAEVSGDANLRFTVEAENNLPGHPDKAILFDTANPTGDDSDLATPGPGVGNNRPEGMVLIIAEDDVDANSDDLVDDPDDEALGGVIRFDFATPQTFRSATVLDVDGVENSFIVLEGVGGAQLALFDLQNLGNNSSQTVQADVPDVATFELHLGGSGALSRLTFCPTDVTP